MTVKLSEGGLWWGTVTFLTPEAAYLSFSLPEVYITHLGEPKRSSCVKFPLPGKRWTCPQEFPQQFPTPFTGQGGQPARCFLIYLLLYVGIWISFAQANPTWQWWPNPNETILQIAQVLNVGIFSSWVFMYHLCMLRPTDCISSYALCIFSWGISTEILSLIIKRGWEEWACQTSHFIAF